MKRIFVALTLLVFTALFIQQQTLAANDKALFWELKAENATVYMFGSLHLADSSFYPLRSEIEAAFDKSQALAVEADMLNVDLMEETKLLFKYGMYPAGKKLTDHISDSTYKQLQAVLKPYQLKIPVEYAIKFRPGTLVVTLGYLMAEDAGLEKQYGLDLHFLKQASSEKKQIIELEGSEQLMKVMQEIGPAEEVIKATIEQMSGAESENATARMVELWKKGDEDAMEQLLIAKIGGDILVLEEMMDVLLYDRNRGMVEKIEGFIEKGGTYFVVVGVAHLVGDKGVPALLEGKGFEVHRK